MIIVNATCSGSPMAPSGDGGANATPCHVVAVLEVQEGEHTSCLGHIAHLLCFGGIPAEWFVAEHVVATIDRSAHVVEVHERRRMDRDEVDVCSAAQRCHRGTVMRRDDVHDLAPFGCLERGSDHASAEALSDHAYPHRGLPSPAKGLRIPMEPGLQMYIPPFTPMS